MSNFFEMVSKIVILGVPKLSEFVNTIEYIKIEVGNLLLKASLQMIR